VFGRQAYLFKLLFELALNSGFDTLRQVWFIIGRNCFLASTQIDSFPTAVPTFSRSRYEVKRPLFMIEGGRAWPAMSGSIHRRLFKNARNSSGFLVSPGNAATTRSSASISA